MTQKERLVELLNVYPLNICIDVVELADYLLKNGVIVPPCKVGDTVYLVVAAYSILDKITYFVEPIEGVVVGIWKGAGNKDEIDVRLNSDFGEEIIYRKFEDYKKTFFLDRKEAQAVLERMINDA